MLTPLSLDVGWIVEGGCPDRDLPGEVSFCHVLPQFGDAASNEGAAYVAAARLEQRRCPIRSNTSVVRVFDKERYLIDDHHKLAAVASEILVRAE
jgi:hypothetical protein